jgi:hypothetical protein
MGTTIKQHKILPTGVHCITDTKGNVNVYTKKEYKRLSWWDRIKVKYFK